MLTIHSLFKRFIPALLISGLAFSVAGCASKGNQPASAAELNAFNGGNGKMPADFKAKLQAAQQNGQTTQQQASQSARQKAAVQPPRP